MPGAEQPNYILYVVPIFIATMVLEALVSWRRGRAYRLGPALSDLGCGIVGQVAELFIRGLGLWVFAWAYQEHRLVTFEPGSPWPWVIAFIGVDLGFYWWHRASHVVNVLWAVHGVHHQSEEFNLAVALRQPAFEALTIIPFYTPLALLGVDPFVWVVAYAANLSFQFFVHTELVRSLGPLEWIFNTPSHHRVHHGINPEYLDRNYAGVLILWDRLFGTFEPERAPVVYGVTKPLRSYNPVWANFEYFATILRLARSATRWRDRLWAFVAHPAWRPGAPPVDPEPVDRATFRKYDPALPRRMHAYVRTQLVLIFIPLSAFSQLQLAHWPVRELAVPGLVIVASLVALAGLLDLKPWAWPVELGRQVALVAVTGMVAYRHTDLLLALAAAGGIAALQAAALLIHRPWRGSAPESDGSEDPASPGIAAQDA